MMSGLINLRWFRSHSASRNQEALSDDEEHPPSRCEPESLALPQTYFSKDFGRKVAIHTPSQQITYEYGHYVRWQDSRGMLCEQEKIAEYEICFLKVKNYLHSILNSTVSDPRVSRRVIGTLHFGQVFWLNKNFTINHTEPLGHTVYGWFDARIQDFKLFVIPATEQIAHPCHPQRIIGSGIFGYTLMSIGEDMGIRAAKVIPYMLYQNQITKSHVQETVAKEYRKLRQKFQSLCLKEIYHQDAIQSFEFDGDTTLDNSQLFLLAMNMTNVVFKYFLKNKYLDTLLVVESDKKIFEDEEIYPNRNGIASACVHELHLIYCNILSEFCHDVVVLDGLHSTISALIMGNSTHLLEQNEVPNHFFILMGEIHRNIHALMMSDSARDEFSLTESVTIKALKYLRKLALLQKYSLSAQENMSKFLASSKIKVRYHRMAPKYRENILNEIRSWQDLYKKRDELSPDAARCIGVIATSNKTSSEKVHIVFRGHHSPLEFIFLSTHRVIVDMPYRRGYELLQWLEYKSNSNENIHSSMACRIILAILVEYQKVYVKAKKCHLDIKPENIIINYEYLAAGIIENVAFLVDLGSVKNDCEITSDYIGTEGYLATEIYTQPITRHAVHLRKASFCSEAADIYSIGVLLGVMNQHLVHDVSFLEVVQKMTQEHPNSTLDFESVLTTEEERSRYKKSILDLRGSAKYWIIFFLERAGLSSIKKHELRTSLGFHERKQTSSLLFNFSTDSHEYRSFRLKKDAPQKRKLEENTHSFI